MFMKCGVVKVAKATYSIFGESENSVNLSIVDSNKKEYTFENVSLISCPTLIKKTLNLPMDYQI